MYVQENVLNVHFGTSRGDYPNYFLHKHQTKCNNTPLINHATSFDDGRLGGRR